MYKFHKLINLFQCCKKITIYKWLIWSKSQCVFCTFCAMCRRVNNMTKLGYFHFLVDSNRISIRCVFVCAPEFLSVFQVFLYVYDWGTFRFNIQKYALCIVYSQLARWTSENIIYLYRQLLFMNSGFSLAFISFDCASHFISSCYFSSLTVFNFN